MSTTKSTLLVAALVVLLGACSSTPVTPPPVTTAPAPTPAPAPAPPPAAATPQSAPPAAVTAAALPPYLDPKNPLSTERSIYFDFDDARIKKQYVPVLELHAKYLSANPKVSVRLEGNTDERGSEEYNLALGQRRADAVLNALATLGVPKGQMEAISWGKTKPKALGHDEAAWAQNRRVDIQYPSH